VTSVEPPEAQFQAVDAGLWRGLFRRLPLPVVAFGADTLFLVSIEGSAFALTIGETTKPVVGFFTHRIVAARTEDDAQHKAFDNVCQQWRRRGYEGLAQKRPTLIVNEIERLPGRFRLRSGAGFSFHRGE